MAATPFSLDSTLQPLLLHYSSNHPSIPTPTTINTTNFPFTSHSFVSLYRSHPFHFNSSHPSSRPPPPSLAAGSTPRAGPFLDATGLARLETLDKFSYAHEFGHGWLEIRPMEPEELDPAVQLLAESFAESMSMPPRYVPLLAFLVKQYVVERRLLIPNATMLVGFYRGRDGGDAQLACTAEISFGALGAIASPPTPLPPKDFPYICNMAVKKPLRRRGIGWQLLKACEKLISQMKTSREVYLHCRVVDTGPFNMYTKAGYKVAKKDTILVWITLQRRKYLMRKKLPILDDNQSIPRTL